MDRRTTACVIALLLVAAAPSPSLAVRGIDAPHVQRPPKSCGDALKSGARVKLRVDGGQREIFGEVAQIDSAGLGLRIREDPEGALTYFDRARIVSMHVQRRRFPRPKSSFSGLGIGMLVGMGAALAAGYPGGSSSEDVPDMGGAVIMLGGATVGFIIGTTIPIISPGEKEIECAW